MLLCNTEIWACKGLFLVPIFFAKDAVRFILLMKRRIFVWPAALPFVLLF